MEVLVEGPSKHAQKFDRTDEPNESTARSEEITTKVSMPEAEAAAAEESQLTQLVGRTPCDRIVVFPGNRRQIGQLLPVTIYDCTPMTLFGAVVTQEIGPEVYSLSSHR